MGIGRDTGRLATESANPTTADIDLLPTEQMLRLIAEEDAKVASAVAREIPNIARAVDIIAERMKEGGRLFFVGAGTSGRLGVMEAAECPPTFGTKPGQVKAIIAGGRRALLRSIEGAEDSSEEAVSELKRVGLARLDSVVGIAASVGTPFVAGALRYARRVGASTVLICSNHADDPYADVVIELIVGPEVIAGSTRLKAGTATKMALNMLTTSVMVRLGKTYGNLMVEVKPSSQKLRSRQERIVSTILGVGLAEARALLEASGRDVKCAVLMGRFGITRLRAKRLLARFGGHLRRALGEEKG
ncbi:MAG: N-acetylmuramic acid 6-phosphate etherase [Candidatus Methanosuratincola sp.]